jgi:cyclophilin family peptidyl-prolyl cis-trans isomerase
MKTLMHAALSLLLILPLTNVNAASPKVRMDTSEGTVVIELNAEKAPTTVANFLRYVQDGKYDGTIFHRVIKGFMNQGGGFTAQYTKVDTYEPIINEADNGLKNKRGTIAMARTGDPNSATNQFFINTVDNAFLDHSAKTQRGWGYCVFGEVVEGMDVMDRIAQVKTGAGGPFGQDVPKTPVVIKKVSLISETEQPQEK